MPTLTPHANGVAPTPDPYLVTRFDPGHGDQGGEPPLAQVIRSEKGSNHLPHSSQPAPPPQAATRQRCCSCSSFGAAPPPPPTSRLSANHLGITP